MRSGWLLALALASVVACGSPAEPAFDKQTKWLRTYVESFNKHDAEAIAHLHAPDAVFTELGEQGQESKGTAEITAEYKSIFDGFPDAKTAITRSWHMGDAVLFEYVEGGTSTADDDTPAKRYGYVGASLVWFDADGRVTRDQTYYDELTMEVQVGWARPILAELEVRPVHEVPTFTGTWEQHRMNGTPEEAKLVGVREHLYAKLTASSEQDFLDAMTDDVVLAAYDEPKDAVGKPGIAEVFQSWKKMFSNIKVEATHSWACEDFAIFEGTFSGKHTGAWGPIEPTNRDFKSHFLDVTHITKDGKVDRMWTYANNGELLTHLGVRNAPKK